MDDAGQLIYKRRTGPAIWLFLLGAPIAAMAAASEDRNWTGGIISSVIAFLLITATLWFAIGWSGRTRLAEVRLRDGILIVKRSHIFDRGKVLEIPLSETGNWTAMLERYGDRGIEAARFDHGETTYILQIGGAEHADLDVLNGWVEKQTLAGRDWA